MFCLFPMRIEDYDAFFDLMRQTSGISLRDADSRASTHRYLQRNPGLSFIARVGEAMVGCVMAGHDGRRGYLQHLLVHPDYRRKGIANALVHSCLEALDAEGIQKCHIDVIKTNVDGAAYWESQGWQLRSDIHRYSLIRGANENA